MIHFLSDLHLSPRCPGVTNLFLGYLAGLARQAQALYILGDLFEAWIGDDDETPYSHSIVAALKATCAAGVSVHIQHGNRDFLLGQRFADNSGASLLPDPCLIELSGRPFLLSHGDSLCTDDLEYMAFRRQVRDPEWQKAFLAQPLSERRALAALLRQQSEQNKQYRQGMPTDLNPLATDQFIRHHGPATFIHGHTHQPATHYHLIDGLTVERWVLADWHDDGGEVLIWDGNHLARQPIA